MTAQPAVAPLSGPGRLLVNNAPTPARLATKALAHLTSTQWDQTEWVTETGTACCVGSAMALAAGFRPGQFDSTTHTGDSWWRVCAALIGGELELASGLSLFAPEAESEPIAEALVSIIAANADRAKI